MGESKEGMGIGKDEGLQGRRREGAVLRAFSRGWVGADIKQIPLLIQLNNRPMALSSAQRTGFAICLVLTILLVGLHFSVAGSGHIYFKDHDVYTPTITNGTIVIGDRDPNYANRDFNQFAAFLIIAAGLTFIISIVLLIALCADKLSPRLRHILATFNLIIEFAIAVTVAIAASMASNLRDRLYNHYGSAEDDDLNLYYRLAIADAVITFVLQVVYLVVIYFGTLDHIEHHVTLVPTVVDPPITADRLH